MRLIIIIGFFTFLASCNNSAPINQFIPDEYNYPDDSMLVGKTFIYEDTVTGQKAYTDCKLVNNSQGQYITSRNYVNGKTYDSTISLNNKMIETYSSPYIGNDLLKCQIIQDTIIKNGTKLGQSITKTLLRNDSDKVFNTVVSEYLKDTLLMWNNKSTPCIIISNISRDEYRNSNDSITEVIEGSYNGYYCKKLGLVEYTSLYNGKVQTFILREIKKW